MRIQTGPCAWAGAVLRLVGYAAAVAALVVLAAIVSPADDHGIVYQLGLGCALVGVSVVVMQIVLAARYKWIERPVGQDMVFVFHTKTGILAGVLIVLHPVLLSVGSALDRGQVAGLWRLIVLAWSWRIVLGKIALLLVLAQVIFGKWYKLLPLKYEGWLFLHGLGPLLILPFAFLHGLFIGHDLRAVAMQWAWLTAFVVGTGSLAWLIWLRPASRRRHACRVVEVNDETHNVHTIRLAPTGEKKFDFLPGQFHFVTFYRDQGPGPEEHPWTISASPTEPWLQSSIKESGDFTNTMGLTRVGDVAAVHGPFGRFSYLLHPHEKDLVFLAGGIGITPLRSMIRHMADTGADLSVLLLYGNRSQADIAFRDELEQISARPGGPRLKVVHVLSEPDQDWQGERGYITREMIEKYVGGSPAGKAYYICGPYTMADKCLKYLEELGVPDRQVHIERFWLG